MMQAGGDFYFNPKLTKPSHDLLLLAGGVGVNPLLSIFQYVDHLHSQADKNNTFKPGTTTLLYSAKTYKDILYKVSNTFFND